ncbi:hypothetical protein GCM10017714_33660 [Curtobacterium pusillum]|uniref:Uncharacterized protein n=1 Tax=Curtobacterium pusillum TaxID=69373 RepID=A0ABX2M734_9MICO|nr:hypothetical protein [Curtobacterium pusillum]NUU12710.1 hypothetical protein [Curtobacterium pusillum]GLK31600.1 hypothetical protein GCM10017610_18850 [Curtobacterium pusillum]
MSNARVLVVTPATGDAFEVTPNISDTLAFETTLRKNKAWGSISENAMRMQFFRAWSAAKREGKTTQTWDEWSSGENAVVDVTFKSADDVEAADAADHLGEDTPEGQPTSF